jgi:hypothetical protein
MTWDPAVLRRYTTTGHLRLLNQVRTELRGNPLIRPKDGETVGAANRSRSLTRAIENRAQAGMGRSRRAAAAVEVVLATPEQRREALQEREMLIQPGERGAAGQPPFSSAPDSADSAAGFRARLNAIDMR